jgi:hypothetical protein
MARVLIQTDTEPPPEFTAVFPQLTTQKNLVTTTLSGELPDPHDLRVVLNALDMLGVHVSEVLTDPAG